MQSIVLLCIIVISCYYQEGLCKNTGVRLDTGDKKCVITKWTGSHIVLSYSAGALEALIYNMFHSSVDTHSLFSTECESNIHTLWLSQGHFGKQTGAARDYTTNFPISNDLLSLLSYSQPLRREIQGSDHFKRCIV